MPPGVRRFLSMICSQLQCHCWPSSLVNIHQAILHLATRGKIDLQPAEELLHLRSGFHSARPLHKVHHSRTKHQPMVSTKGWLAGESATSFSSLDTAQEPPYKILNVWQATGCHSSATSTSSCPITLELRTPSLKPPACHQIVQPFSWDRYAFLRSMGGS